MSSATETTPELPWLLGVVTIASVVGVFVAESMRKVCGNYAKSQQKTRIKQKKRRWKTVGEFINYLLTAFILVVTSFDKSLLLTAGYPNLWYAFTFILCILLSDVFSSCFPSPLSPLQDNWEQISNAGGYASNSSSVKENKKPPNKLYIVFKSILEYFKIALPSLLGQFFGLHLGILWLRIMWDKVLTSYHRENLYVLDKCNPSFNTNITAGFIIEFLCTVLFLSFSKFISTVSETTVPTSSEQRRSSMNPFKSELFQKVVRNLFVILLLYIFLDITGCYANPFLAYAVQQHCLSSHKNWFIFTMVYLSGPLFGTIVYCGYIEHMLPVQFKFKFNKNSRSVEDKQK